MALVTDMRHPHTLSAVRPRNDDRLFDDIREMDVGRSNFVAFLMGGVVISGGLLAFLYYDTGNLRPSDMMMTGSISREAPGQAVPSIRIPMGPQQPANGSVAP